MDLDKVKVLTRMASMGKYEFLCQWVELWDDMGDNALDCAMLLLRRSPEATDKIDAMLRLSYRCTLLKSAIKRLCVDGDDVLDIDPPQGMLDDMRAVYLDKVRGAVNKEPTGE